ncbi:unnamed protein product [Amoebophrya sp. A120]|nr:unnamed protein product [Amoebophrya sp. A120]|eukprot:GSA120T00025393001.1
MTLGPEGSSSRASTKKSTKASKRGQQPSTPARTEDTASSEDEGAALDKFLQEEWQREEYTPAACKELFRKHEDEQAALDRRTGLVPSSTSAAMRAVTRGRLHVELALDMLYRRGNLVMREVEAAVGDNKKIFLKMKTAHFVSLEVKKKIAGGRGAAMGTTEEREANKRRLLVAQEQVAAAKAELLANTAWTDRLRAHLASLESAGMALLVVSRLRTDFSRARSSVLQEDPAAVGNEEVLEDPHGRVLSLTEEERADNAFVVELVERAQKALEFVPQIEKKKKDRKRKKDKEPYTYTEEMQDFLAYNYAEKENLLPMNKLIDWEEAYSKLRANAAQPRQIEHTAGRKAVKDRLEAGFAKFAAKTQMQSPKTVLSLVVLNTNYRPAWAVLRALVAHVSIHERKVSTNIIIAGQPAPASEGGSTSKKGKNRKQGQKNQTDALMKVAALRLPAQAADSCEFLLDEGRDPNFFENLRRRQEMGADNGRGRFQQLFEQAVNRRARRDYPLDSHALKGLEEPVRKSFLQEQAGRLGEFMGQWTDAQKINYLAEEDIVQVSSDGTAAGLSGRPGPHGPGHSDIHHGLGSAAYLTGGAVHYIDAVEKKLLEGSSTPVVKTTFLSPHGDFFLGLVRQKVRSDGNLSSLLEEAENCGDETRKQHEFDLKYVRTLAFDLQYRSKGPAWTGPDLKTQYGKQTPARGAVAVQDHVRPFDHAPLQHLMRSFAKLEHQLTWEFASLASRRLARTSATTPDSFPLKRVWWEHSFFFAVVARTLTAHAQSYYYDTAFQLGHQYHSLAFQFEITAKLRNQRRVVVHEGNISSRLPPWLREKRGAAAYCVDSADLTEYSRKLEEYGLHGGPRGRT